MTHDASPRRTRFAALGAALVIGLVPSTDASAQRRGDDSCRLSRSDSAWTVNALDGWNRQRERGLRTPPPVHPALVLFDSVCVFTMTPVGTTSQAAGLVSAGQQRFGVVGLAHGGSVRLPNGDSVPPRLTSFAAPGADGGMFFVMSLPAVWKTSARGPEPERLATAVFIHEFTHTQSSSLGTRVDALVRRGMPADADDDVIQTRFGERAGFRAAYEAERDLLFAAALAADRSTMRSRARQALRLIERRRARYFRRADALYAEAEDLFLTMEGTGQWAAYLWLTDPAGAAMQKEEALSFIRRGGRRWSQDEGLALLLLLERVDPGAAARLFGPAAMNVRPLLARILARTP